MRSELFTCDGCGTQKRETNHWYWIKVVNDGFHIYKWGFDDCGCLHACGRECAAKKLEEWLAKA